jgi:hypothetical protein
MSTSIAAPSRRAFGPPISSPIGHPESLAAVCLATWLRCSTVSGDHRVTIGCVPISRVWPVDTRRPAHSGPSRIGDERSIRRPPQPCAARPMCRGRWRATPSGTRARIRDRGVPLLTIWRRGSSYVVRLLRGNDVPHRRVRRACRGVVGTAAHRRRCADYLLGSVLAFVLRLRGLVPLHASAVVIGDRAVLFAGSAGAGSRPPRRPSRSSATRFFQMTWSA